MYSEKLTNFIGAYDKEIDISKNPKGVYFVRIEQGKHAQVKKVVLD
ncbi:MAG: T9SS type A sorting domain-containing protein [Bacteroidetes bacterium]|nr:T9SS type A sorting domain-containing protein [Bacteroidota bacterium]